MDRQPDSISLCVIQKGLDSTNYTFLTLRASQTGNRGRLSLQNKKKKKKRERIICTELQSGFRHFSSSLLSLTAFPDVLIKLPLKLTLDFMLWFSFSFNLLMHLPLQHYLCSSFPFKLAHSCKTIRKVFTVFHLLHKNFIWRLFMSHIFLLSNCTKLRERTSMLWCVHGLEKNF